MTTRTRGRGTAGMSELNRLLSERDKQILQALGRHRFLTTDQIERFFFTDHATVLAGARACRRVLRRLDDWCLAARLPRRVGGITAGSATSIWSLAPAGARILSYLSGDGLTARVREPSVHFVEHTLAIAEAHLRLLTAARAGRFELTGVQIEQESWRSYLSLAGQTDHLKPDLAAITATPEFEDHWFIEIDLGTEHLPTIQRKCQQYQTYRQTGTEQANSNVFPIVIWVAPTPVRADKLRQAITGGRGIDATLFRIVEIDSLIGLIAGDSA